MQRATAIDPEIIASGFAEAVVVSSSPRLHHLNPEETEN